MTTTMTDHLDELIALPERRAAARRITELYRANTIGREHAMVDLLGLGLDRTTAARAIGDDAPGTLDLDGLPTTGWGIRTKERNALTDEVMRLRTLVDDIYHLHTDSPAGVCPSCGRIGDQSDTDDGLVNWPCPTVQAINRYRPAGGWR
jgi:hypothetical protein